MPAREVAEMVRRDQVASSRQPAVGRRRVLTDARQIDILVELATREHEAAIARVTPIQKELRALDRLLQDRRESLAREQRAQVAETVATMDLPAGVVAIALETEELNAEIAKVIELESALHDEILRRGELVRELFESFSRIRERVATYGASQAIGRLLQRRLNRAAHAFEQSGDWMSF